eukprot:CAMPEP_0201671796 /NCGR_PEP_ID=MMETSP0494-20130426/30688_1 /ASSEMBLY_ACC=CAM_ASM_000839 /TAXON_ID=420259 /ORGANISM="Thalassiosira gravida, Strain GMp14c1" /LENGTH=52 /DNA_ID=CAMNT_0048153253 /DNA_START=81 /DNA_END=236 /DNA_ORIENTATION=+
MAGISSMFLNPDDQVLISATLVEEEGHMCRTVEGEVVNAELVGFLERKWKLF